MERLPQDVREYRRTAEFDEASVPKGLLRSHTTKAGVWGEIRVLEGHLHYRVLGPEPEALRLGPGDVGIVAPQVPHEVEPDGPVRFYVAFLRVPEG